jgi:hypothetical protein
MREAKVGHHHATCTCYWGAASRTAAAAVAAAAGCATTVASAYLSPAFADIKDESVEPLICTRLLELLRVRGPKSACARQVASIPVSASGCARKRNKHVQKCSNSLFLSSACTKSKIAAATRYWPTRK